jgi:hypothetical protein
MFLAYGLFVLPTVIVDGCHVLSACPARCSIAAAAAPDWLVADNYWLIVNWLIAFLAFLYM